MKAIDLFAGAGGFSEGARQAGLDVVWAANHWKLACDVHEANHGIKPKCQDLHQADWTQVPAHDIMLASPSCKGHSKARGKDRPHHDAQRATAWAVVSAAECHRPRAIVVENVPEMAEWVLFPAWCSALEALGYTLSAEILCASRFQVPQFRERLFIVAARKRFVFPPVPTTDAVPIRTVLDLDGGEWLPWEASKRIAMGVAPFEPKPMARILAGRKRHGDRPFWVPYFGPTSMGGALTSLSGPSPRTTATGS
ncbi:DNA cytosine methyltransferase [Mesoterricola sediminis]|uniref:DNA (cytosine-5-)-methyltransferase n=1 Tax=Mesoterricola sediminis TaxID=2927980 RepID=A0AA48GNA6_9BACT|nr:DNA (cytosine-5-)-methyltransferase [Mesoterricola sediminis]BDU76241.1 DNA methyltransferase [Mesoterricola sediminis]